MTTQLKEYKKNTTTYLHLETHAQRNKLLQDEGVNELTCVKEGLMLSSE